MTRIDRIDFSYTQKLVDSSCRVNTLHAIYRYSMLDVKPAGYNFFSTMHKVYVENWVFWTPSTMIMSCCLRNCYDAA